MHRRKWYALNRRESVLVSVTAFVFLSVLVWVYRTRGPDMIYGWITGSLVGAAVSMVVWGIWAGWQRWFYLAFPVGALGLLIARYFVVTDSGIMMVTVGATNLVVITAVILRRHLREAARERLLRF